MKQSQTFLIVSQMFLIASLFTDHIQKSIFLLAMAIYWGICCVGANIFENKISRLEREHKQMKESIKTGIMKGILGFLSGDKK